MSPWLTPDTLPTGETKCLPVLIPNSTGFQACVEGALLALTELENWEEFGTATPEECVDAATEMYLQLIKRKCCMPIGSLVWMLTDDIPDYLLICDGSILLRDEYPLLFEAIGTTYGPDVPPYFWLPYMLGRYVWGREAEHLGEDDGANEKTIAVENLPPHTHTYIESTFTASAVEPGPAPIGVLQSTGIGNTGATGGGEAFNVRPRSLAAIPCIVAR